VIVPFLIMRNLLGQNDSGQKRDNLIKTLQEYDLDIRIANIVKGQGLCKIATESTENGRDEDEIYQD
jgi:hypothetical protein